MGRFALLAIVLFVAPLAAACHENGCDQPPFYECGTYNRETRTFCYYLVEGRYVRALEENVVNLTLPPWSATPLGDPLGVPEAYVAYLWLEPVETFLAEPADAPLPHRLVFRETNGVHGLQASPFKCANWIWFAEYPPGCWIGPYNVINKPPDEVLLVP